MSIETTLPVLKPADFASDQDPGDAPGIVERGDGSRVRHARRHRSGRTGIVAAGPVMAQDRLGENGAGGIAGTEKKNVARSCHQAHR